MKIATIIPFQNKTVLDNLTYFTTKEINNGDIVSVLVRNKKTIGLVVDVSDAIDTKDDIKKMPFNLKKILDTKGPSIFRKEFIESAIDTSKYFCAKKSIGISSLIPAVFKEKYDKISKLLIKENTNNTSPEIRSEKLLLQISYPDRISFYKTLIRESFASKKSIFIVLPNERDIREFTESLSKGIENFTFTMHSGVSSKKIIDNFKEILNLEHPILLIGTAPFLSIPRYDFGTIILEHESSNTYRMMSRPYFDLRIFVEVFAAKTKAKLIFGDSLLSFETLGRKEIDHFAEIYPMSFRTNFDGTIEIPEKEKKFKILTDANIREIEENISKNKNIFIFSLRKGLATMTICRDCSEPLMCKNCLAPVVLYTSRDGKKRMFVCNRCKNEIDSDTICGSCGSWNLTPLGIGTDTVYEEIKKIFSKDARGGKSIKILKLDKESAKTKKGAEEIIKEFEENPGSILVGTEMAFFYLKNKVQLSIIASFDSLWSIPNFKMNEKIIQIINSLINKTENKIIIQTKNSQDKVLLALKGENLSMFIREELEDRQKLGYPPFKRFIKIRHFGDKEESTKAKEGLTHIFSEYSPDIFSGFVAKQKNKYATNMLIKIDPNKWSLPELSIGSKIYEELHKKLSTLPPNFEISVDPEDLL